MSEEDAIKAAINASLQGMYSNLRSKSTCSENERIKKLLKVVGACKCRRIATTTDLRQNIQIMKCPTIIEGMHPLGALNQIFGETNSLLSKFEFWREMDHSSYQLQRFILRRHHRHISTQISFMGKVPNNFWGAWHKWRIAS